MGYFVEDGPDGSITFRKDRGRNKKSDKKKMKHIRKLKKVSKRVNRKR